MLTAFKAQPIVELRPRDKSKIESILAFGDRLLVGLNTGSLRIYRVNEHQEAASDVNQETTLSAPASRPDLRPVELLRELEKFSRRAILQLAVIKESDLLISLTDSYVSIHDLQTYTLQEQLSKTKGAETFAVTSNIVKDPANDIPSIVSRLAVSVKRKLIVWSWHDTELSQQPHEITLQANARTLTWASGTNIVCGMNSGYVLVNIETEEIQDLAAPGSVGNAVGQETGRFGGVGSAGMGYMGMGNWVPKPQSARLINGEILLARDINTLFVDKEGVPLERRQIPWSVAPEAISFTYPYLLALQTPSKGILDIRSPDTQSLLQSIPLQNASILHVPQPNVSLAHAGKGFLIGSERCIWKMKAVAYESQVDELVEKGLLDEAISLLDLLEDALFKNKPGRLREIKMQKAVELFGRQKYRESLDLFTTVTAPPDQVIGLYPPAISGDLQEYHSAENGDDQSSHHQAIIVNEEVGEAVNVDANEPAVKIIKSDNKNGTLDSGSTHSSKKRSNNGDVVSIFGKHSKSIKKSWDSKELRTAALELNGFLVDTRKRYMNPDGSLKTQGSSSVITTTEGDSTIPFHSLNLPPDRDLDSKNEAELKETARLVDTTLFRSYMLAAPSLAGSLFRIPNFCDPDVVNEKLLDSGRYNDLVDFLHGKKLHRRALDLLLKFGQAKDDDDRAPSLRGPRRTVGYLQNLPPEHIDLILEFARWPLNQEPDLGMEIFVADTENAETLPRDKVVNFLQECDPLIATKYLEHIIQELNDLNPEFHNLLVKLYLERLKPPEVEKRHKSTGLLDMLKMRASEKPSRAGQFRDIEEREEWKAKMQSFLRTSKQYTPHKAFGRLPEDDPEFYEARAIVLSKMGQHRQALKIYVFDLKDQQKAEEYCNRIYVAQESAVPQSAQQSCRLSSSADPEDGPPSIYHTLLSLYLTPPPPHQANWPPALDLLSKHGARLPAYSTLDLIPATLPVKQLESYFGSRIRAANSIVNESRVLTGLHKSELVDTQAALLLGNGIKPGKGRNRHVVISEERVCGVCHKRLGRSVISVLPE
ncbi:MAG: Vacuolar morphogenesis protein 6 [Trizodia sp. TS-e1964]|nr:MAG: Vacuolar morphogenesis protein 6 [Trizodia sp. TS-e1964]